MSVLSLLLFSKQCFSPPHLGFVVHFLLHTSLLFVFFSVSSLITGVLNSSLLKCFHSTIDRISSFSHSQLIFLAFPCRHLPHLTCQTLSYSRADGKAAFKHSKAVDRRPFQTQKLPTANCADNLYKCFLINIKCKRDGLVQANDTNLAQKPEAT